MAPSVEIDKTTEKSNNKQKVPNIRTLISQLEPLSPQAILIVYKIPTGFSLLYRTGDSVTPEQRITKKVI